LKREQSWDDAMPLVSFNDLMGAAKDGGYAVGYFESWDKHSLMAVADAAKIARSPVLLGFSGLHLSHPEQLVRDPLSVYAALGLEVCRQLPTPSTLVFNESPDMDSVLEAAGLGFNLVMYSDEGLEAGDQLARVKEATKSAHLLGAAVEGEIFALPGISNMLVEPPAEVPLTSIDEAIKFAAETGVDALAVNLGQMHLHGRRYVRLNLDRLRDLTKALSVPMVLHGASSVQPEHLQAAIEGGIRKINVGSKLKQTFFETLREASNDAGADYNPYRIVGSGLDGDVLMAARLALRDVVVDLMKLFGSAGKA
jgi:fructose-bisphosphate aldolase class II